VAILLGFVRRAFPYMFLNLLLNASHIKGSLKEGTKVAHLGGPEEYNNSCEHVEMPRRYRDGPKKTEETEPRCWILKQRFISFVNDKYVFDELQ
jgi:hypothetical protein